MSAPLKYEIIINKPSEKTERLMYTFLEAIREHNATSTEGKEVEVRIVSDETGPEWDDFYLTKEAVSSIERLVKNSHTSKDRALNKLVALVGLVQGYEIPAKYLPLQAERKQAGIPGVVAVAKLTYYSRFTSFPLVISARSLIDIMDSSLARSWVSIGFRHDTGSLSLLAKLSESMKALSYDQVLTIQGLEP